MTTALLLNILLVLGGIYFGVRNVHFLRSESALRTYMEKSPKALLWVRTFGMDRATRMARVIFVPLGLLISIGMAGIGAWKLWRILG